MDSQTRHALKQDKFVQTTQSGVSWVSEHRGTVTRLSIAAVLVLGLLIAGTMYFLGRSGAAETALGSALDVYGSPLAQPGVPAASGVYSSAIDRAKEANRQFVAVARDFGWLPEGAKAHYFAGLTYQQLGQPGPAESELKLAAGDWMDTDLAGLAKFALAGFYHQNNRDAQSIEIYNALIAKPTHTVPAYTSQLALAELYQSAGKPELAKQLWAKIKDADKTGPAGSIATEKLAKK